MDITEKTCTSYLPGPALFTFTKYTALLRYGKYGRRGKLSQQERVRLCHHSCQKECSRNLHSNRNQRRQLDPANTGVFRLRSFCSRAAMCRTQLICSHQHLSNTSLSYLDRPSKQPAANKLRSIVVCVILWKYGSVFATVPNH